MNIGCGILISIGLLGLIPFIIRAINHLKSVLGILAKIDGNSLNPLIISSNNFINEMNGPFKQIASHFEHIEKELMYHGGSATMSVVSLEHEKEEQEKMNLFAARQKVLIKNRERYINQLVYLYIYIYIFICYRSKTSLTLNLRIFLCIIIVVGLYFLSLWYQNYYEDILVKSIDICTIIEHRNEYIEKTHLYFLDSIIEGHVIKGEHGIYIYRDKYI